MNLYLYIPPVSAHPPSCFKGLIAGELRRYFIQNNKEGFEAMLTKFIGRLLDRGHSLENILPLLLQAATNLDNHTPWIREKECKSTLFIHWPFHPKGLQRQHLSTGVVVRPEVSYLRVVGSSPTQWTGSVLSRCV